MSERDDALRSMAVNRGCKLVKSRRRKPGGDFGRYGLKDAKSGKELLGFGAKGLTATAEEIEAFLRGDAESSWKSSLRAAGSAAPSPPPSRREAKPSRVAPRRTRQASTSPEAGKKARAKAKRPEPDAPKPPRVREARPADSETIAGLLVQLGYEVSAADVRRRLAALRKAGEPALVADRGGLIGCMTWHITPVIHRPRPVGRITMLVVAEGERGGGVGSMLVAAAEERLRALGCGLVEVTSNIRRMRAHAFYERLGFDRTSYRFAKTLQE
jgi:GNAT superfamily N-acetyltransferase